MSKRKPSEFERAAGSSTNAGFFREFWDFLKHNKKWWMLPLVLAFLILGALVFLSSTGLAPFIYTLF
jgi:Family of unknown function (DUF5989)